MINRTTQEPSFHVFRRGTPTQNINELLVPEYLARYMTNPSMYAASINSLCICNFENGQLVPNEERTQRAKKELIKKSPVLMHSVAGTAYHLLVRVVQNSSLEYRLFEGNGMLTASDADYITGNAVAQLYARRAGICTPEQFDIEVRDGRLVPFVYRGNISYLKPFKLYLLSEVNALAQKKVSVVKPS